MADWGIRVTTFLTNSLVLVGYALLYSWLQMAKMPDMRNQRLRQAYLCILTIGFVLLFHFSSIFAMAQANNAQGVGWTYINFQAATVMFALLANRRKEILYSLATMLLVWYWWLPRVPNWAPYFLVTLGLLVLASVYGGWIGSRRWRYYPFVLLFFAPFAVVNVQSLGGIDVGWPWEIATTVVIAWELWQVHYSIKRTQRKQALLREEARIDELTQLYNFRVFNEDLLAVYNDVQANRKHFALYTLDIDHFKAINDRYGHLVGNRVLEQVAGALQQVTESLPYPQVKCYRTGGEEFSFIIEAIIPSFSVAQTIAWQVYDALGALRFEAEDGTRFGITVSLGEDRSDLSDQNYLDVYNRADQYLYASKNSGRNTITINGQTLTQKHQHR